MSMVTAETGGVDAELSYLEQQKFIAGLEAEGWKPIELFGSCSVIWGWGDTNYRKLVRPGCPVLYYQRRPD